MEMVNKVGRITDVCFGLVRKYVSEIIILMFIGLFFLWSIGYLANAIYGYHFDLSSCWGGFSAIGGAGVLAAIKYCTDSWKNSPEGEMPADSDILKLFDKNCDGKVTFSEIRSSLMDKTKDMISKV
jgi:hypothetical protein